MTQTNIYQGSVSGKWTCGKAPKENQACCIQGTEQFSWVQEWLNPRWELKLQHRVKLQSQTAIVSECQWEETHQREGGESTKPTGSDDHNQSCIWPSLVLSLMFWRVHCFRVDKALRTGVTSPYSLGACSSSNCRDAYELVLLHWRTCCRKLWCTRQIQELCANV